MPKNSLRHLSAALAAALTVCVTLVFAHAPAGIISPAGGAAAQAPVSLHLTLGNPSGATTNARNRDNFLLVKPQFVLSYNNSRGAPNWVSWHLQDSDIGSVERGDDFHPEAALPAGRLHRQRLRPRPHV